MCISVWAALAVASSGVAALLVIFNVFAVACDAFITITITVTITTTGTITINHYSYSHSYSYSYSYYYYDCYYYSASNKTNIINVIVVFLGPGSLSP